MTQVHIRLLGPLVVTRDDVEAPPLSRSVRQLVGLIAASGKHGLSRDALAHELWGQELPDSWQSALRNRVATARKALGIDTLLNTGGRFCLADSVTIDSWQLVDQAASLPSDPRDLSFLDGVPLVDIDPSRVVSDHVTQVTDARAVRVRQLLSHSPLPAATLQKLRDYQRSVPLDAAVTGTIVRAHIEASEFAHASSIVAATRAAAGQRAHELGWINELGRLITSKNPDVDSSTPGLARAETSEAAEIQRRADLFRRATNNEDWSMALEIATAGLPEAARIEGDPARLALLEAIPLDKLDPARQFSFCLTLARHLLYAGRENEAVVWSRTARNLAATPDQQLLAYITSSVVGESSESGRPIPLPPAFDRGSSESVSMQSLQVAVMSHLKQASFGEAAPLVRRFAALVEASADPYRRWHGLLIESMEHFVDGHFRAARDLAMRAFDYAELFGIVDAEIALIGQLSNLHWIEPRLAEPLDYRTDYVDSADSSLSRALQARASACIDNASAHAFLRSYNLSSRTFFTLPTVVILADAVTDPTLRSQVIERLRIDTGTSAIWGSGVMHLGPVDRTLARLTTNPEHREYHLRSAVACADRQRFRVWQVACRLDLAAHTGNAEYRSAASALATTQELQQLVAVSAD